MNVRPNGFLCEYRCIDLRVCLALALGISLTVSSGVLASESATPFLELESEVPLDDPGVGLDIAADPKGGLYLSDQSRGGIRHLGADSAAWDQLVSHEPGSKVPRHPASIQTDPEGRLWVADIDRRRVVVLGPEGAPVQTYEDGRKLLRKPARIDHAPEGSMTVWDAEGSALVLLGSGSDLIAPIIAPLSSHPGAGFCVPAGSGTAYCVGADRKTLTRQVEGKIQATWTAPGPYPRIADLAISSQGAIYLIDTGGRRLYLLDSGLRDAKRLRLYESLFQSPTRLALAGDRLWLLDEGRKSVLRLRLRVAETAWEHAFLGEEYLAVGLAELALQELTSAQHLGLDHPDLTLAIGAAHYRLEEFAKALTLWDALPPEDQARPTAQFWRANALFRLDRHQAAATLYDAIPPSAGEYLSARFNFAQAKLAMGDNAAARTTLRDLLQTQPENDQARLALARALLRLGQEQEAETLLTPLTRREGLISGEAAYMLGQRRLAAGDARAALPMLEQAARLGPHFRDSLADLAAAHSRLGDLDRARFYEQRASDLKSDVANLATLILEDAP